MPIGDFHQEYGPVHRRKGKKSRPRGAVPVNDREPDNHRPDKPDRGPGRGPSHDQDDGKSHEQRPRRIRKRRLSPRQSLVAAIVGILLVPLILPYAIHLYYYRLAMSGVTVEGVPVARLDQEAITTLVAARHMFFHHEPVTITFETRRWKPSLEKLGVTLDANSTAAQAFHAGKHGDPLTRWRELLTIWQGKMNIAPSLVVDQHQMQSYVIELANEIEYSPNDATLSVAGGDVVGTPGVYGRQVLVDETSRDMLAALQSLHPQDIILRTRELSPTIDDDELDIAEQQAQQLLAGTLVLTYAQNREAYRWPPDKLAELVSIEAVDDALQVAIDSDQLTRAVERLAQQVDSGSVEPRLRFEAGELHIVEPGREGWRLRQTDTIERITDALQQDDTDALTRTIALPVKMMYPRIRQKNLHELGIVELVGEGKSSFAGSADYRITNIKAASARFDGVLIAPGDTFSFNTQLGSINAEHGFVEGYAVIGNRTQLEWGGGVCQNSTTVFRAAFWAGLPIVERHAHPFYISWYDAFAYGDAGDGPGMDATIYTGILDVKFVNDTEHWLLMQTDVDLENEVLVVQLYGTKPDRQVDLDGPYISNEVSAPSQPVYVDDPSLPAGTVVQTDAARSGRDIVIHRIISENGIEVASKAFFTRFKPWPNVFVRGTGAEPSN